ncbi:MAG: YceD family protein [Candidatus Izimaplasma sp.]|nr:YceD family protein [Candidatus Izimaplasma bacterium]
MKWTIQQLVRLEHIDNKIDETLDFSEQALGTDIEKITPVHVTGRFETFDSEEFIFYLTIDCTLTLLCARTLKPVKYPIHLEVEEAFTTYKHEETHLIDGITIDLLPKIWSNILLEKPMRVISEEAPDEMDYDNTYFEPEEDINPAFAELEENDKKK